MSAAPKLNQSSNHGPRAITPEEYRFFANKMSELSGVYLPENDKNRALLNNRLSRFIRKHRLESYADLVEKLKVAPKMFIDDFISSLTTNLTSFFREKSHFDFLAAQLQKHYANKSEIRIWSAACSSGHEAYTIAIVCAQTLGLQSLNRVKILATDIDNEILNEAAQGIYSRDSIKGMSPDLVSKYFQKTERGYQSVKPLEQAITYCPFNLTKGPYQFRQGFDFIFCRNVLIYFNEKTCTWVVDHLAQSLQDDGYLLLGHSESGAIKSTHVQGIGDSIFRKKLK